VVIYIYLAEQLCDSETVEQQNPKSQTLSSYVFSRARTLRL